MIARAWSLTRANRDQKSSHCWSPCSSAATSSGASCLVGFEIWTSSWWHMMYRCEMVKYNFMYLTAVSRPFGAGRHKSFCHAETSQNQDTPRSAGWSPTLSSRELHCHVYIWEWFGHNKVGATPVLTNIKPLPGPTMKYKSSLSLFLESRSDFHPPPNHYKWQQWHNTH